MLLPITDIKSIILSSVLNLKISSPEIHTNSLLSHSSKRVLPSKLELSLAPEICVIGQTFDLPTKIYFGLKEMNGSSELQFSYFYTYTFPSKITKYLD